jgi:hypothetical protein
MLFASICHILPENENRCFDVRRKNVLLTENHVKPNPDDRNHALFITIDIDLGSERTIR